MDKIEFNEVFSQDEIIRIKDEFSRLQDTIYLDTTGSSLYAKSQIESMGTDFLENIYTNPHSHSSTSKLCEDTIDQIRYRILQHFNTDPKEYSVIFTSGATESLKIVAESFLWTKSKPELWQPQEIIENGKNGNFCYMEDNHTSVLGMRNVISKKGINVQCLSHDDALELFNKTTTNKINNEDLDKVNSLFVYSAQCNFSGVKYPLNWIDKIHNNILNNKYNTKTHWYCMLDAASYASTNLLDLSIHKPDFVCISFYKIFGYPTGIGALIVKNSSSHLLRQDFYGGGTVQVALSSENKFVPRPVLHERFENGTLNFLNIISLKYGFNTLNSLTGSMSRISKHSFELAKYTFYKLITLHHSNGNPAVRLYCDTAYDNILTQGNIVNFNILRPNGEYVGYAEVLHLANLYGIQLRTGCFCNPGACRRHLNLTDQQIKYHFTAGHVCGDDKDLINGIPTGSVRISFGYYSTKNDAEKLLKMLEDCFVQQPKMCKTSNRILEKLKLLRIKFNLNNEKNKKDVGDNYCPFERRTDNFFKNINNPKINTERVLDILPPWLKYSDLPYLQSLRERGYLSHIFIYPIKSCGKFSVRKWQLDETGLKYDRNWMIVNSNGVVLTQKRERNLCLIRPIIDLECNKLHLTTQLNNSIVSVPLEDIEDGKLTSDLSLCQTKICRDKIRGFDCGDDAANWISDILNRPGLRLIRQFSRNSENDRTENLSLANQAQYLLINETSVRWLSDQIREKENCSDESMLDRFRSNFIISGLEEAFIEQKWSQINVGDGKFKVDGPCNRCQMICIDQNTGNFSKEPLTALSANFHGKIKFGIYLSWLNNRKTTISVFDAISFQ